jgi:hypothetical protein
MHQFAGRKNDFRSQTLFFRMPSKAESQEFGQSFLIIFFPNRVNIDPGSSFWLPIGTDLSDEAGPMMNVVHFYGHMVRNLFCLRREAGSSPQISQETLPISVNVSSVTFVGECSKRLETKLCGSIAVLAVQPPDTTLLIHFESSVFNGAIETVRVLSQTQRVDALWVFYDPSIIVGFAHMLCLRM